MITGAESDVGCCRNPAGNTTDAANSSKPAYSIFTTWSAAAETRGRDRKCPERRKEAPERDPRPPEDRVKNGGPGWGKLARDLVEGMGWGKSGVSSGLGGSDGMGIGWSKSLVILGFGGGDGIGIWGGVSQESARG